MKAAFHRFVTTVGRIHRLDCKDTKAFIIYLTERRANIEVNAKRTNTFVDRRRNKVKIKIKKR